VVIPQFVVARHEWFRLALAHELQHHRQRDTAWLYLFGALRVTCALNPGAWAWSATVARHQESACDEALLARGRWSLSGYAQGLLDVARAAAPHRGPAWAPSLIGTGHSLKRRIEDMMNPKKALRHAPRITLYVGLMTAFALTAAAASSLNGEVDAKATGALPIRTGALAASFEIPEEGAGKRAHAGVDIVARAGTPVYAWHEGVVVHAGERKGCGTAVVLQHWQGTRSVYCNLAQLKVTAGESVGRDQAIGQLADLGAKKKPHLHFEIEVDGRNVDPARQLDLLALK
jgi:murein DD-endopeptidase MepM/ murein hydrolase activator NlpD